MTNDERRLEAEEKRREAYERRLETGEKRREAQDRKFNEFLKRFDAFLRGRSGNEVKRIPHPISEGISFSPLVG